MNWHITNQDQLQDIAQAVCDVLVTKNFSGAATICLHGDLGAGKTTFTKYLAQKLGVIGTVTSPTFVIMQSYDVSFEKYTKMVHMDWYRLERAAHPVGDSAESAGPLRLAEYLSNPHNICVIEWSQNIPEFIPTNRIDLNFTWLNETEREISLVIHA